MKFQHQVLLPAKYFQAMRSMCLALANFLLFPSYGSTSEFWGRRFHTSVIAGDWMYIDGGEIAYGGNTTLGDGKYDRENNTYGLDLSKNWTTSSLKMIQTERPLDSHTLNGEVLWYDNNNNTIYCFGGDRSLATPVLQSLKTQPDSLWGFRLNGEGSGAWYEVLGPVSSPFPSDIHRVSSGMSVSDGNRAYYLGGFGSSTTSLGLPKHLAANHGLLMFDFNTRTMTNTSDDGYIISQYHGAMINIPTYGDNGVLVILPFDRGSQNFGFNNITFYDKQNKKRYSQVASGDIPPPRSYFCAVGIEGDEYPYFEIFIHGGANNNIFGPQIANSDQVYILSLPSFRWFRASYTPVNPRVGHTCHATNSSQMIMIGGVNPTYFHTYVGDTSNIPSDPWPQGIGVFDMTALKYKDSYQANAGAYETPDVIKKYHSIDGNKYPPSWTSDVAKNIFGGNSNKTSNAANPTTPNSTVHPGSTSSSVSKSLSGLSHGVVAGVAVGCTAAIVLSAIGGISIAKHRSKRINPIFSPNELASISPFQSPLRELSVERPAQEILSSYQDRAELPNTTRICPIEISASEPIISEMSAEDYRSRA